jgi:hypothetical protein
MKKKTLAIGFVLMSMVVIIGTAYAGNITGQAFGERTGLANSVTGVQSTIWTAQQPSGWYALSSPMGTCSTVPPRCAQLLA